MISFRACLILIVLGCHFQACRQQSAQDLFSDFVIGVHKALGFNVQRNPNVSSTDIKQNHFIQVQPSPSSSTIKTTRRVVSNSRPNYEICGKSKKYVPLISQGERSNKGDWPWVVAVFKREVLKAGHINTEFRCGATLISTKMVVTAAHCVTRSNLLPLSVESLLLKLGAYNLDDETDDTVINRGVSTISVHEGHNVENKNDIAMLLMSQRIRFNFYVRPVCLWPFDKDQNLIDGKVGTVVGWGRDETGSVTSEPKMVKTPIVSVDKCRAAGAEYFSVTSKRTFCGGGRDGSGPCVGDSGGGLYIVHNNTWYIRGIVSLSVSKSKTCDLNNYIVYTDVAMYDDWVQSNLT